MIIYGSNKVKLATENIYETCTNCEAQNSVFMTIYIEYAHVFWIPLFPGTKKASTYCSHCHITIDKKKFSSKILAKYKAMKLKVRTPIWSFTGLVILAVLVPGLIINEQKEYKRSAEYILAPLEGDIYKVKIEEEYTLFKVHAISGDTILLLVSLYVSDMESGLKEIKKTGDQGFYEEIYTVLKSDITNMFEKKEIIGVDR